ncbi:MAG: DUF502 domain-containing protein [Gammaproteobacteria bacterium]|nr:MAG: DUF502 domain-containing protein [Gammaproteobacteria bacterium]
MKHFRRYIVAGLLVWVPLGVTVLVLKLLADAIGRFSFIPPALRPENLIGLRIPYLDVLLTLLLAILVLYLTGLIAANILGRQLVGLWESILHRIPLVRTIYSATKKFAEVLFADTSQSFKKVLLIEYPRKGVYSLCFQTSTELEEIQARTNAEVICVFVPTTPNPTSGFIIMVPKNEVIELDMDVESALKMVVSLGVVVPAWRRRGGAELAPPRAAS